MPEILLWTHKDDGSKASGLPRSLQRFQRRIIQLKLVNVDRDNNLKGLGNF